MRRRYGELRDIYTVVQMRDSIEHLFGSAHREELNHALESFCTDVPTVNYDVVALPT